MTRVPPFPRLPLVPDPLRRIRVPKDLDEVITVGEEADPADGGLTAKDVETIWQDVVDWYRSGVHPAIQICLRRRGAVVLDRSIGHSRPGVRADTDTPFCVYSSSKAITAFLVHKHVERGLIGLDDRVAEYIPGYERHDKGEITIGQVLSHRAGVPNLPREAFDLDRAHDREYLLDFLVDAKPFRAPGRSLAYHAVSGGYIMAEVLHQVTGKPIRELLAAEFLDPLGFRWTNYGIDEADLDVAGLDAVTGPPLLPPASTFLTRALGVPIDEIVAMCNDRRMRLASVPSANVFTNANELSRFFEVMRRGGELDGVRVIEPETIAKALEQQSHLEVDLSLAFPTRFSYGLMLGARLVSLFGRNSQEAFGHLGFTNTLAWADPERETAVAFVTNGKPTVYPDFWRPLALSERITSVTGKR